MMTDADVRKHLDSLTKPPGSLGRLEDVAARLCVIQQTLEPQTKPRRLVLFAGDHGVVEAGVTAWPSEVTALMVTNIATGGAASSVLASETGTSLDLIDVGVASQLPTHGSVRAERVRSGTRNLAIEGAITGPEYEAAIQVGRSAAARAANEGCRLIAAGEMGIGNTTPASCLTAAITGADINDIVGRGAGSDDATLARKREVVKQALARCASSRQQATETASALGGLEIAAMTGLFLEAADRGLTIVLDGFIATAAALVAHVEQPAVVDSMIAAHRSAEPGHTIALQHLGLEPVLDGWNLRLGEGTGALTALPLLDAAAAVVRDMATFEAAGIQKGDT